ncbi:MAG TPA: phospholipase D-like domain-containing protein [Solirubrobacteraceae bacterium]
MPIGARTSTLRRRLAAALVSLACLLGVLALSDAHDRRPTRDLGVSAQGLSLITEPQSGIGPVLELIAHAQHRVLMTIYELTDSRVEDALTAAAQRGVQVSVLLGRPVGFGAQAGNREALVYLRSHRVAARYGPPRFALTHQKSLEVDGKAALIMTFNLTPRYYAIDRDFAVLDRRRADVAAIARVFRRDWREAGDDPKPDDLGTGPTGGGSPGPDDLDASPTSDGDSLLWSPGATPRLLMLIADARRTLQVESEELSDGAVVAALCEAEQRGVRVQATVAYDASPQTALARLHSCGVAVRSYPPGARLYIHAKAIVADGAIAFVGSQNLSAQSLYFDRELGIVFSARPLVQALSATLARDFAGAYSTARR